MLVGPEVIDNAQDRARVEGVIRTLTGRPEAQVVNVRPVTDKNGKALGYEVDIR